MPYTFDETLTWTQQDNGNESAATPATKSKYSVYSIAVGAAIVGLPLALGAMWLTSGSGKTEPERPDRAETPVRSPISVDG